MKRKRMFLVGFIAAFVFGYLLSPRSSLGEPELNVGILDFPPFYLVEEGREPGGPMLDLLKKVLDRAKLAYTVEGFPPKRLYMNLAEGRTDVFMGVKGVPEYEGKVLYSNFPTLVIDMKIYTRNTTPLPQTIPELNGKKIIAIRGYSYGGFITYLKNPANQIIIDETTGHEQAFKKLLAERADYLLDYGEPAGEAIKSLNLAHIQEHSLKKIDVHFVISLKTANARGILAKMEKAYQELKDEGEI